MVKAATPLVRASTLTGRPVVTGDGDAEHEVQDLVLDEDGRSIAGFTLREPGVFGRRHVAVLPLGAVTAIGSDAVMADGSADLEDDGRDPAVCGDVVGTTVMTAAGTQLGKVSDVVVHAKGGKVRAAALEVETDDGTRYAVLEDDVRLAADVVVVADGTERRLRETPADVAEDLGVDPG